VDAQQPGLIQAFGGHAMAAGLSLAAERLDRFRDAFQAAVSEFLGGQAPRQEICTDGELSSGELNLEFARALSELGPWGQRFPEPLFEGAFEIINQRVVGGAHLKLSLRPMDGRDAIDAIAFRTLPEDLHSANSLRALYRLDVNHFRGMANPQLVIERIVA
jgi:single-stranded-DNA-specific exonuclease